MGQTWESLVFLHWRIGADELRAHVPESLEIDEFDGSAWLGITPFRVTGMRARGLPPIPGVSSLNELNVRTLVRAADGKHGVWFFSLDATSRLAVETARKLYRLPYFDARLIIEDADDRINVECARKGASDRLFSGVFRPTGQPARPASGSVEEFLTERYCLYATHDDALWRAEIHHGPWVLQTAAAELGLNAIAPFELTGTPLCHIAERQDVVIWPLERVVASA
jgi:uncharacterized protein YqjF (DUF2071 family)